MNTSFPDLQRLPVGGHGNGGIIGDPHEFIPDGEGPRHLEEQLGPVIVRHVEPISVDELLPIVPGKRIIAGVLRVKPIAHGEVEIDRAGGFKMAGFVLGIGAVEVHHGVLHSVGGGVDGIVKAA